MRARLDPAHHWATAARLTRWIALSTMVLLVLYGLICLALVGGTYALRVFAAGAAAGAAVGLVTALLTGFTRRSVLVMAGFSFIGAAMFGLYASVLAAVTTVETVLTAFAVCLAAAAVHLVVRLASTFATTTPVVIQEGPVA